MQSVGMSFVEAYADTEGKELTANGIQMLIFSKKREKVETMAISNIKVTLPCERSKVWNRVTSLENTTWRSDLSKIEVLNEKQFVEYTKEGYATTFTITASYPNERWEFDMENRNIKGHWCGIFTEKEGKTEIDFTEDVTAKIVFLKPFVKGFLKQQQKKYVEDLKKALL